MGAVVKMLATDAQAAVVARLVGRTRRKPETWIAHVIGPEFDHFVYLRRVNDPMYVTIERMSEDQFLRSFVSMRCYGAF